MKAVDCKLPPQPEVIGALERLLEQAKEGELQGFVLVGTTNKDMVYTEAQGAMKLYETLGNLAATQQILAAQHDEQLGHVINHITWG